MSHELTFNSLGLAEMAYATTGGTPWHGLGQALPPGQTIDQWQQAAGMAWTIEQASATFQPDANASPLVVPDRKVLFRSDNTKPLSIVSSAYQVVQPKEVLEFFRDLTESLGFALETAGTLYEGRKFWALARITEDMPVADLRDTIGGFLLLSTSCDGSMATEARFTSVRVVCNNTLRLAKEAAARVRVTHRSQWNPADVKASLGLSDARERFSAQLSIFRKLAEIKFTPGTVAKKTANLLLPQSNPSTEETTKALESAAGSSILHLTFGGALGSDLDGATGTAWGWLNAVTEFVDFQARAKSSNNRLDSAWFGAGDRMKEKALDILRKDYELV
jgi:phage/plasmid-like protein (TIGR03299 family)